MSDLFEFDDRNHAERFVGTLHDPQATVGDVLTVQADKSIAAQPGGGGGSGVQVVTVPVSSAQILDLFNTPVVLIPGVAGSVTLVAGIVVAYVAGLVPYLDGGGALDIQTVNPVEWASFGSAGFWDQPTGRVQSAQPSGGVIGDESVNYDGVDVVMGCTVANPTLGDGILLVTLSYFLAPVV